MRLKIIAGNLVAVLAIGLLGYAAVKTRVQDGLEAEFDAQIDSDAELFKRSYKLSALQFVDFVRSRAQSQSVKGVFTGLDESSRRRRSYDAAEAVATWFQDPSRRGQRPQIVAVLDETGRVIARDGNVNDMFLTSLLEPIPSLRAVITNGAAVHDVWHKDDENKYLQVAIAPIPNQEGRPIGALLVGFDLSDGNARKEAEVLGRDVAFVVDGTVYASSLGSDKRNQLKSALFGTMGPTTEAALAGTGGGTWSANLGDDTWVGVTAPLPLSPAAKVAFTVLDNKTSHVSLASEVANILLILMVVGAIAVVVYGFIVGGSLLGPLEQIEEDVLAVINGRTDLRIDVKSAEFGGLAYRINQLINVFTGVSEESEDGHVAPSGDGWDVGSTEAGAGRDPRRAQGRVRAVGRRASSTTRTSRRRWLRSRKKPTSTGCTPSTWTRSVPRERTSPGFPRTSSSPGCRRTRPTSSRNTAAEWSGSRCTWMGARSRFALS